MSADQFLTSISFQSISIWLMSAMSFCHQWQMIYDRHKSYWYRCLVKCLDVRNRPSTIKSTIKTCANFGWLVGCVCVWLCGDKFLGFSRHIHTQHNMPILPSYTQRQGEVCSNLLACCTVWWGTMVFSRMMQICCILLKSLALALAQTQVQRKSLGLHTRPITINF